MLALSAMLAMPCHVRPPFFRFLLYHLFQRVFQREKSKENIFQKTRKHVENVIVKERDRQAVGKRKKEN